MQALKSQPIVTQFRGLHAMSAVAGTAPKKAIVTDAQALIRAGKVAGKRAKTVTRK